MTQYSHYAPMPLTNRGSVPYEVDAASSSSKYPSLLGFVTAIYLISVVTMSTASESTAWIPQVVGIFLGICWVGIGVFAKGQPLAWSRPIVLFVLFTAWSGTGVMVTSSGDYYWSIYSTSLKVGAVTVIVLQCVRSRQDVLVCALLLGLSCLVILFQGIDTIMRSIQYTGDVVKKGSRAEGLLISNANDMAEFGVVVVICSVICIIGYKNLILKGLAIMPLGAALYMIAASGSRMGLVGVVVVMASMYWYHFRLAGHGAIVKRLFLIVVGVLMLAGTVYFVINSPFFFRLAKVASSADAARDEPRFQYFLSALGATLEHPIFGLGLGGFTLAGLGRMANGVAHFSHSTISETLSCTGVLGFLLYFSGRISYYFLLIRTRKLALPPRDHGVVNLFMAFFWANVLFDVVAMTFQHRLLWPMIGATCGYLWQLHRTYGGRTASVAM